MKLITIILGTRPEAIKLAPLIICFLRKKSIKLRVVVTGQHKEMVDQVFNSFGIKYDLNLQIMKNKQTLSDITKKTLVNLEKEFEENNPSLVLVQGDTSSAFAAALAAFYKKIPIGHVEAGLRTNSIYEPFPEEMNRRLISNMASINFAPTDLAFRNLHKYEISGIIKKTGNTVIDASRIISEKNKDISFKYQCYKNKKIVLATVHRRENWGDNLLNILNGLFEIINLNPETILIFPMHPNPIIRDPIKKILGEQNRIYLIEPLDYEDLIAHIKFSTLIITDSGGIQEEAPTFSKPVLVLRNNTERQETIKSGNAKLVGTNTQKIVNEANALLRDKILYQKMAKASNPYGDGYASERIVNLCLQLLDQKT